MDSQNNPSNLTVGRGALDGLLAGVVGSFIWLIVAILLEGVIGPLQRQFAEEMARQSESMPPELRAWFETLASRSTSPFRWAFGFFFQLCVSMIFAPVGGMIGAVFFKKDVPPALGGDYVPPPLP